MIATDIDLLKKEKEELQKRLIEIDKLLCVSLDDICDSVQKKHRGWNIRERGRYSELILARNEFFYIARNNGFTLQTIADYFDMSHASVIHGIKKHKKVNGIKN